MEELRRESRATIRTGLSSFTENQSKEQEPHTNTQMSEHENVHIGELLERKTNIHSSNVYMGFSIHTLTKMHTHTNTKKDRDKYTRAND